MANGEGTIVIKKIIKGGGGHHGGAWKFAYADFVTAMMAFFTFALAVERDDRRAETWRGGLFRAHGGI